MADELQLALGRGPGTAGAAEANRDQLGQGPRPLAPACTECVEPPLQVPERNLAMRQRVVQNQLELLAGQRCRQIDERPGHGRDGKLPVIDAVHPSEVGRVVDCDTPEADPAGPGNGDLRLGRRDRKAPHGGRAAV